MRAAGRCSATAWRWAERVGAITPAAVAGVFAPTRLALRQPGSPAASTIQCQSWRPVKNFGRCAGHHSSAAGGSLARGLLIWTPHEHDVTFIIYTTINGTFAVKELNGTTGQRDGLASQRCRVRVSIEIFPGSILAKYANAQIMPFYEADEASRQPISADKFL